MTGDARHFHTDTVRAELRHRTVRSGAIAATARIGSIALQLGSVVVLARVLTPRDFGIQAMVLPLTVIFNSIVNLGLQTAVIQQENLEPADASAMFSLGLVVNLGLAALMAAGGMVIAWVNETPEVTWVALAWAAVVYVASASAVIEAVLKRQLRFGVVWAAHLGATAASVPAAIVAALAGAGYWALMVQIGVMEVGRAVVVWSASAWRPSLRSGRGGRATLTMRGQWLSIAGFRALSMAGDQLDRVLAGIVGGASALGLYETSKRYAALPFVDLFLSLSDVVVSSLSRVNQEPERYRRYVEYALLGIVSLSLPAIAFIVIEAGPIVLLMLGSQWVAAEPFVRVLGAAAIAASLMRPMQWINLSRGESARQLRWTLISTPAMVAGVLLGSRSGAIGVGTGFAIALTALVIPCIAYTTRGSPVTAVDLMRALGRPVLASGGAAAALTTVRQFWAAALPLPVALGASLAAFAGVYTAVWLGLPGGRRAATDLMGAVGELRWRRSRPPG